METIKLLFDVIPIPTWGIPICLLATYCATRSIQEKHLLKWNKWTQIPATMALATFIFCANVFTFTFFAANHK